MKKTLLILLTTIISSCSIIGIEPNPANEIKGTYKVTEITNGWLYDDFTITINKIKPDKAEYYLDGKTLKDATEKGTFDLRRKDGHITFYYQDGKYGGFYEDGKIEITSYYLFQGKESFVVYKAQK